jgi:hypothetical protein
MEHYAYKTLKNGRSILNFGTKIFVLVGDKQVARWMSCSQIPNQRR